MNTVFKLFESEKHISRLDCPLKAIAYVCFALVLGACEPPAIHQNSAPPDPAVIRAFAEQFFRQLGDEGWTREWRGAMIGDVYYVEQHKGQPWDLKLNPVWYAQVKQEGRSVGYLMWDHSPPHHLLELGLDVEHPLVSDGKKCQVLNAVGNLQQFPVRGKIAPQVASGCVPTSAANVISYWVEHGIPQWQGGKNDNETSDGYSKAIARRLRDALPVGEMKDTIGYTKNGMPLTGVNIGALVKTITEDANDHSVQVQVTMVGFSRRAWKREIAAGRPVLLNCVVRLPHKPHLSWGHEVTGIGWAIINGEFFVIVRDNFYPTNNANAVRVLRAKGLGPIIRIIPKNIYGSGTR